MMRANSCHDGHRAGTANPLAARATERQRRIDCVLDPDKGIEAHRTAIVKIDAVAIDARIFIGVGIEAINPETLDPSSRLRCWPRSA